VRRFLCLLAIVAPAALAPVADAAFPGANGRIAFDAEFDCFGENYHLQTVHPDGGSLSTIPTHGIYNTAPAWSPDGVRLTYSEDFAVATIRPDGSDHHSYFLGEYLAEHPSWSPDGTRIVFTGDGQLHVVNSDGTAPAALGRFGSEPVWSPDGTRIAFAAGGDIHLIDPDGGNLTNVTNSAASDMSPDWSPDGSRIAFSSNRDGNFEIYTIGSDGSSLARLSVNSLPDLSPAWSPDGTQITFARDRLASSPNGGSQIWKMSSAGAGETVVQGPGFTCLANPDWQPLPALGYPRPRAASPMYLSLVPAYRSCTAPNSAHGAPLSLGSCAPPVASSSELTLGTRSVNAVVVNVKAGNRTTSLDEADVRFRVAVRDVRRSSDLADYTGELEARAVVRITDRDNTPHPGGPGPGTATDGAFAFDVPCTTTADGDLGSTCGITTTADAVAPGAIKEERRAIWALDSFEVRDVGGSPFLRQGLFVP
jgi:WD40-like Beta Propeller Repeat